MTNYRRLMLVPVLLVLVALACSAPVASPTSAPTAQPPTPTPTPALTATQLILPTPTVLAGWETYPAGTLRLTLMIPPGWEVSPAEPAGLVVTQPDADGWAEVTVLSGTGNNLFGLAYSPGLSGDAILSALLDAAREDGIFDDPHMIAARAGVGAWISEGRNDVHDEQILIAAIGLPDRAFVLVGHGGEKAEEWPALAEIYQGIIANLEVN